MLFRFRAATRFAQIDDGLDAKPGQVSEAFTGGLSTAVDMRINPVEVFDSWN